LRLAKLLKDHLNSMNDLQKDSINHFNKETDIEKEWDKNRKVKPEVKDYSTFNKNSIMLSAEIIHKNEVNYPRRKKLSIKNKEVIINQNKVLLNQ